jgi:hypothetical protein
MTLEQRLAALAQRAGTECKALRTLVNGNAADLTALTTTAKTNLVAALNEVRQLALDAAGAGGATLNDAATNSTEGWTSQKITDYVAAQLAVILGPGVPAALNTLDELAAALGDDSNFAATMTTALGNRLRVDAAQTLTAPQKAQACANAGAAALVDTGNLDADFVSTFNTALA